MRPRGVRRGSLLGKNVHRISGIPVSDSGSLDLKALSRWELAMRKRVDAKHLAGFSSCVVHRGKIAHVAEYGYADVERRAPFTKDSICRTYCMTKTVVAVGILILMERGKLKLTDPVSKYLPAFKRVRLVSHANATTRVSPDAPNVADKFTILRLLTHTAGCGYGADFGEKCTGGQDRMLQPMLEAIDRRELSTLEDYCNEFSKLPLRFQPGVGIKYAMGHDVLARIIEVVSRRSLGAFLEAEIFRPLGMRDTGFFVPRQKAGRLAGLYCDATRAARMVTTYPDQTQPKPSGKFLSRIDGSTPAESNWIKGRHCAIESGNGILGHNMGGLVSTLADQARFFTMVLNGGVLGSRRILQTSTVETWCFKDLLPLPGATGKRKKTGAPWSGWSALGERGMKRLKGDSTPALDEYEEGEVAMAGVAQTTWSVNPIRDTVQLFFTQSLDSDLWRPDKTTKSGRAVASAENFTVAARTVAPRDSEAALLRRRSLSGRAQAKA